VAALMEVDRDAQNCVQAYEDSPFYQDVRNPGTTIGRKSRVT
jgi:hypothetical protein